LRRRFSGRFVKLVLNGGAHRVQPGGIILDDALGNVENAIGHLLHAEFAVVGNGHLGRHIGLERRTMVPTRIVLATLNHPCYP